MTCGHPVLVRMPDGTGDYRVPCGHCRPCRIARAREWTSRMMHEQSLWPASSFVTLTYDDEHLPGRGSLLPVDVELWLKRLRRELEPRRMRYYVCGEYGERLHRPHYHGICFGLDPASDRGLLMDSWSFGFVGVGYASEHSIRYVADYVQAKVYGKEAERVYEGRVPPFARMSQGLGRDWCDARAEELRASMSLNHRGHEVALPRYYARRLGITYADSQVARMEHALEVMRVHNERNPGQRGSPYAPPSQQWYSWLSVKASNKQSEVDAEARWKLFRRGLM